MASEPLKGPNGDKGAAAILNENDCVAALSRALETTDEDLFDAIHVNLLRLIATFVPFCTLATVEMSEWRCGDASDSACVACRALWRGRWPRKLHTL